MEALVALFTETLSGSRSAEPQLEKMRGEEQFCQLVLQLVANPSPPVPVRQAAALYFKNIAKYHWDPNGDTLVRDSDKSAIRQGVVDCMVHVTDPALRRVLSDAIAAMSKYDFPHVWPDLMQALVSKASTTDLGVVHAVLSTAHLVLKKYRSLVEMAVSDRDEILQVTQVVGEPMLMWLTKMPTAFNGANPEQAVGLLHVFNDLMEIFYDLNCHDIPPLVERHLQKVMEVFLFGLQYTNPQLVQPPEATESSPLDKNKALLIQCVTLYIERYDEDFKPYAEQFVQAVWQLTNTLSRAPCQDELAIAAMELMGTVARTIYHTMLADPKRLQEICEKIIIPNMELRDCDVEMFEDNATEYIRRDMDGSDSDTRRRSACELIQGLARNYEGVMTTVFQKYVGFLLEQYNGNPQNWKFKDTAMYLITALVARSAGSAQHGTNRINELVNIGEFFGQQVLPELQQHLPTDSSDVGKLVLKADSIKFVTSFRIQIPKEAYLPLLGVLAQWILNDNEVVHSYAATAVDRLLSVKDDQTPRISKNELQKETGPLLQNMLRTLTQTGDPNPYLMKAMTRVITVAQETIAPFLDSLLGPLVQILTAVAKNPTNAVFNHHVFECIAAIVRFVPQQSTASQEKIVPILTTILHSDTEQFHPYVFQLFALLLEVTPTPGIPATFLGFLPTLVSPQLYQNRGNIPAIIKLLREYLAKGAAQVLETNQLVPMLGVFQSLVNSKSYDHEGFNLLNAIIEHVPLEKLGQHLPGVFNLVFTRLMSPSKTPKYIRCVLVFMSLFALRLGPDALIETVEGVQAGLWKSVFSNVFLGNVQKVRGGIARKVCSVGMTRMISDSNHMTSDAFFELWPVTVVAVLKMLELGEEVDQADIHNREDATQAALAKLQEEGWTATYCPLQVMAKGDDDPCRQITDVKAFFVQNLQRAVTGSPQAGKCMMALQQQPEEIKLRLRPLLGNI